MGQHKCNKCKKYFEEEDMDRDGGGWICRECEDEDWRDKNDEFGGVF